LLPTGKKGTKRSKWRCKCDCGNFVDILSSNLYNGNSTSCGCKTKHDVKYNFIDLTGKQFGDLIVINLLPEKTKHRGALWNCQCKCGNFVKVASNSLTSGNKLTCGKSCSMKRRNKRVGEISLAHINAIKQNAIKRNLSFTVTPQYLWDLFLRQNRKCALSGVDLTFTQEINTHNTRATLTSASLDRIDSSKGYDERNVRWVHKDINRMKWSCDDATFLDWCKKCILHHHESKNFTV